MQFGLELWLFTVALGTSMLGGVLGMASGIFIVPILTMFGHMDIHTIDSPPSLPWCLSSLSSVISLARAERRYP